MKKYGVSITFSQYAYVEVEAEDKEDAEEKAFDALSRGEAEHMGDNEDSPDFDIEEIDG